MVGGAHRTIIPDARPLILRGSPSSSSLPTSGVPRAAARCSWLTISPIFFGPEPGFSYGKGTHALGAAVGTLLQLRNPSVTVDFPSSQTQNVVWPTKLLKMFRTCFTVGFLTQQSAKNTLNNLPILFLCIICLFHLLGGGASPNQPNFFFQLECPAKERRALSGVLPH